jgi:hypothetical protein
MSPLGGARGAGYDAARAPGSLDGRVRGALEQEAVRRCRIEASRNAEARYRRAQAGHGQHLHRFYGLPDRMDGRGRARSSFARNLDPQCVASTGHARTRGRSGGTLPFIAPRLSTPQGSFLGRHSGTLAQATAAETNGRLGCHPRVLGSPARVGVLVEELCGALAPSSTSERRKTD